MLFTWNYAAKETKNLNFQNVRTLINNTKSNLRLLTKQSLLTVNDTSWDTIKDVFDHFRKLLGQTGASKALSLLNPELFVMWDTKIRKRLNRNLIPGIMNGESGEYYVIFLKGIHNLIRKYKIAEKLPRNSVIAKKIDEYHYVKIVMNKRDRPANEKDFRQVLSIRIRMPNNLRGRSTHHNVIPTVCNLENMLLKLKELHGNDTLLKQWEKRSYSAYQIDKIKTKILSSQKERWKEIIKEHILQGNPSDFGASCIDIYLVAYVAEGFGAGKLKFFQYIKENGISQKPNTAQAIWQVGKGDGVFLNVLNADGTVKDVEFFRKWING